VPPSTATLPTRRLRIGWTDHALERFCERAGVPERPRPELEAQLRRLVARDGNVVLDRPRWADSRNEADVFVQIGGWLLVVLVHDERGGPEDMTAVTVLGREGWADWPAAHARGLTRVRPPRWVRPSLLQRLRRRLLGR
jgi:hypothetical protein